MTETRFSRPDRPPFEPLRLAVIIGTNRDGRFGPVVAGWFARQAAARDDFDVDLVDLAAVDLPAAYPGERTSSIADYARRIGEADAIVVVTPEYNHGYPAALKQAIDILFREWQAKPVAFVSYGGISGGLRAVEQLRLVFAELHAVTIRDTVSFHRAHGQFDGEGEPNDQAVFGAAKGMLDQLAWWGATLREARASRPYAA